jgi:lysozyme family protein
MQGNFKECLNLVLKSEGGWTDVNGLKGDPGGETNLGVTKRVWEEYVGHPVESLKKLTKEDVAPLYEQKYWRPCYGEVLPRGLDFVVFSMGVNAGPGRSIKLLQSSIGCVPDGVIGPATRGLISDSNSATLIGKFSETRREYYRSLKTFPIFGKGWLARVDKEESEALNMAKNG